MSPVGVILEDMIMTGMSSALVLFILNIIIMFAIKKVYNYNYATSIIISFIVAIIIVLITRFINKFISHHIISYVLNTITFPFWKLIEIIMKIVGEKLIIPILAIPVTIIIYYMVAIVTITYYIV